MNIEFDPNKAFEHATKTQIKTAIGILPHWAGQYHRHNNSFQRALIANYPYYNGPLEGGRICDKGCFYYPGDPVMHPLVRITAPDCCETLYIYRSAMLATVNTETGETWMTRMD